MDMRFGVAFGNEMLIDLITRTASWIPTIASYASATDSWLVMLAIFVWTVAREADELTPLQLAVETSILLSEFGSFTLFNIFRCSLLLWVQMCRQGMGFPHATQRSRLLIVLQELVIYFLYTLSFSDLLPQDHSLWIVATALCTLRLGTSLILSRLTLVVFLSVCCGLLYLSLEQTISPNETLACERGEGPVFDWGHEWNTFLAARTAVCRATMLALDRAIENFERNPICILASFNIYRHFLHWLFKVITKLGLSGLRPNELAHVQQCIHDELVSSIFVLILIGFDSCTFFLVESVSFSQFCTVFFSHCIFFLIVSHITILGELGSLRVSELMLEEPNQQPLLVVEPENNNQQQQQHTHANATNDTANLNANTDVRSLNDIDSNPTNNTHNNTNNTHNNTNNTNNTNHASSSHNNNNNNNNNNDDDDDDDNDAGSTQGPINSASITDSTPPPATTTPTTTSPTNEHTNTTNTTQRRISRFRLWIDTTRLGGYLSFIILLSLGMFATLWVVLTEIEVSGLSSLSVVLDLSVLASRSMKHALEALIRLLLISSYRIIFSTPPSASRKLQLLINALSLILDIIEAILVTGAFIVGECVRRDISPITFLHIRFVFSLLTQLHVRIQNFVRVGWARRSYNSLFQIPTAEEIRTAADFCVVCRNALEEGNEMEIRKIGRCGHMLHRECLDMYLEATVTGVGGELKCPVCRGDVGFKNQEARDERSNTGGNTNNNNNSSSSSSSSSGNISSNDTGATDNNDSNTNNHDNTINDNNDYSNNIVANNPNSSNHHINTNNTNTTKNGNDIDDAFRNTAHHQQEQHQNNTLTDTIADIPDTEHTQSTEHEVK